MTIDPTVFYQVLSSLFSDVISFFPESGYARVIRSSLCPAAEGEEHPWDLIFLRLFGADQASLSTHFGSCALKRFWDSDENEFRLEIPCRGSSQIREWMEFRLMALRESREPQILLLIQNIHRQKLAEYAVSYLAQQGCEFFAYLDIPQDRYQIFYRNPSLPPIPPIPWEGTYSESVRDYARELLLPEEADRVLSESSIENLRQSLNDTDCYRIAANLKNPAKGFSRKETSYCCYDPDQEILLFSRRDITDRYLREKRKDTMLQEAIHMAQTDSLTGLYNHLAIRRKINEQIEQAPSQPGTLLFLDLDNFKLVNDTFGHAAGDRLLKCLTEKLRGTVRSGDLIGRLGGDEFLVYFPGVSRPEAVARTAEKIVRCVSSSCLTNQSGFSTTCSVGVAGYPQDGADADTLIHHADQALYLAKARGKNCYVRYRDKEK